MNRREVLVVATGVANAASVLAALARAGATARVSSDPAAIAAASHVVLPGVGAFGPAVRALEECGAADALRERFESGAPFLAICLGMQLLFEASEESPEARGLAVIPGRIVRLADADGRVPKLGWERIEAARECTLLQSEYACFAHSYALMTPPANWRPAYASHGSRYLAALERGRQLLCQFHPELSGRFGRELIARWLMAEAASSSAKASSVESSSW
jgi:imidazole glycerol phosphate synthase glutamine amidotransferase subunit